MFQVEVECHVHVGLEIEDSIVIVVDQIAVTAVDGMWRKGNMVVRNRSCAIRDSISDLFLALTSKWSRDHLGGTSTLRGRILESQPSSEEC